MDSFSGVVPFLVAWVNPRCLKLNPNQWGQCPMGWFYCAQWGFNSLHECAGPVFQVCLWRSFLGRGYFIVLRSFWTEHLVAGHRLQIGIKIKWCVVRSLQIQISCQKKLGRVHQIDRTVKRGLPSECEPYSMVEKNHQRPSWLIMAPRRVNHVDLQLSVGHHYC